LLPLVAVSPIGKEIMAVSIMLARYKKKLKVKEKKLDKNGRKRKVDLKWNMQLLLQKQEAFLPSTKTLRAWMFFIRSHSL
jgi:hypothetical protein